MKNLFSGLGAQSKAALIAFVMTTFLFVAFGQGGVTFTPTVNYDAISSIKTPYLTVYGDVFGTDIKKDKVRITLYQLQDDCDWAMVEDMNDNEFIFCLERDREYQVWFDDGHKIKILYVDPGYQGAYTYRIDANFTTYLCARMVPTDDQQSFLVHYVQMEDLKSLIYSQQ